MRLRPAAAVLAALLTLALTAAAAAPALALDTAQVQARLAKTFAPAGAYSGAYARDIDTGADLFAVRADTGRIPASVNKLFVTATALLQLGPTGQIPTRAATDAEIAPDGTLEGDLWLVGGGDPTLGDDALARLAAAVRAAGVVRIAGDVVGDDTAFDHRRGGPRTGYRPDYDLGGRLGALVVDRGFHRRPTTYTTWRFARSLRRAGIRIRGHVDTGRTPEGAADVATVGSPAIGDLIRLTNVPSDNFYADMLLKVLGAENEGAGTTRAGARVVRDTLDDLGIHPRIADGSGLSRENRTTPRQVVRLLELMEGQQAGQTFEQSLAVSGRTGTVRTRLRRSFAAGRCHLKTGTINWVSNLAGICVTRGGDRVAFAWLMQGVGVWTAHRIQDRMTSIVARYSGD